MINKIKELRERIDYEMEVLRMDFVELCEINAILEELEEGEVDINKIEFIEESLEYWN